MWNPTFQNSLLHCENPDIRKRISCAYGSVAGTKAVFQCKTAKPNEPYSYCIITCKDDGNWTDELNSYVCRSNNKPNEAPGKKKEIKIIWICNFVFNKF